MKPKIIHTETFSCADDHPIVWYTFDENNEAICEYCSAKFIFKPKDFHDKMMEEKELLDMSMKESIRQKEERTPSEEMQERLEPIDSK
jgi:DNA-directed RNA polymerase subunit RPC12/RpoP